eukprot:scaffold14011_cov122-Isochrysis_galbana.AAC.1
MESVEGDAGGRTHTAAQPAGVRGGARGLPGVDGGEDRTRRYDTFRVWSRAGYNHGYDYFPRMWVKHKRDFCHCPRRRSDSLPHAFLGRAQV